MAIDTESKEFADKAIEWIDKCHSLAVEKGWHDKPVPWDVTVCNLHGEISEAWEEYRSGRPITQVWHSDGGKPEGFFVEIADFVIRVFDYHGTCENEICCWYMQNWIEEQRIDKYDVSDFIVYLHDLVGAYTLHAVFLCFAFADAHGVNLWDVIELKHEYNKTRPHRHGGKIA